MENHAFPPPEWASEGQLFQAWSDAQVPTIAWYCPIKSTRPLSNHRGCPQRKAQGVTTICWKAAPPNMKNHAFFPRMGHLRLSRQGRRRRSLPLSGLAERKQHALVQSYGVSATQGARHDDVWLGSSTLSLLACFSSILLYIASHHLSLFHLFTMWLRPVGPLLLAGVVVAAAAAAAASCPPFSPRGSRRPLVGSCAAARGAGKTR